MLVKSVDEFLDQVPRELVKDARPQSLLRTFFKQRPKLLSPLHYFPGQLDDFVLVFAGLHPSEPCGTEIANWLRVKLEATKEKPAFTTLIIPEIFPAQAARARRSASPDKEPGRKDAGDIPLGGDSNAEREIRAFDQKKNAPNRECPVPGTALGGILAKGSVAKGYFAPGDQVGQDRFLIAQGEESRVLDEVLGLTILIEVLKPRRVASIHGKSPIESLLKVLAGFKGDLARTEQDARKAVRQKKRNAPGIYVDPRYSFSREAEQKAPNHTIDPQKFSLEADPAYPEKGPPLDRPAGYKTTFSAVNQRDGTGDGVDDDDLALQIAAAVDAAAASAVAPPLSAGSIKWTRFSRFLVIGNGLHLGVPSVHYGFEGPTKDFQGFSFGDWTPVDVTAAPKADFGWDGRRGGAPVYTIETFGYAHSGAFQRTETDFELLVDENGSPKSNNPLPGPFDAVRSAQLQAYAEGLKVLLNYYSWSRFRSEQSKTSSPVDTSVFGQPPDAGAALPDAG